MVITISQSSLLLIEKNNNILIRSYLLKIHKNGWIQYLHAGNEIKLIGCVISGIYLTINTQQFIVTQFIQDKSEHEITVVMLNPEYSL